MKKETPSFEIALSGIACALSAGCLLLGSVVPFFLAAGYVMGSFAVMIPLSKNYVKGAILCYLAAGLIAVWLNPVEIVPYAVFFGLHPIVNYFHEKYLKNRKVLFLLAEVFKAVWFTLSVWLSYFLLKSIAGFVFPDFLEKYFFLLLFLGCPLFFFLYDFMIFRCQKSANNIIRRLRR